MSSEQVDSGVAHTTRVLLAKKAREMGTDFDLILVRYGIERLLYRLCNSPFADQFVLKGASLFLVWKGQSFRVTKDVDLLGFGEPSIERLKDLFQQIIRQSSADDGVLYLSETLKAEAIRESQEYDGIRVTMVAMLGKAKIPIQIDIGFGDAVVPQSEEVMFPSLIESPQARLKAYTRYTFVAEKVEAMVKLGIANSRMKDFYDLCLLSREFEFDGATLKQAILSTFARRKTQIPSRTPIALTNEFWSDKSKQSQWKAFLTKSKPKESVGSLEIAIGDVSRFIQPVLVQNETKSISVYSKWNPKNGWED